jgi:ubiquinone/menaquinone biosynthesis C-methylase UbiE
MMWRTFFHPHVVFEKMGLTSACRNLADFGCGYGTFTIPAARVVRGTVHALDIESHMVECTRRKAQRARLTNVEARQCDLVADGSSLPDASVDYAMLFNLLHAEERILLLSEAWRVLAPSGRLAVIHWNYDARTPRGPSMSIRPHPEQCCQWAAQMGFEVVPPGLIDLPPYHYGFVFRRPLDVLE